MPEDRSSPIRTCPECGAVLPPNAPESLCAACLFDLAMRGEDGSEVGVAGSSEPPWFTASPPSDSCGTGVRFFGDYELEAEISRGGMGVVFKARQVSVKRAVALKMIRKGPVASRDFVQRFYREAEAVARLDHPNIVPIYEIGQHEGQHFFTMRLVEGPNLAQALAGKPLPYRRAAELLVKIARAVHYAHQRGVLHCDLKPANILLDAAGEPFVTDFGLARINRSETFEARTEGHGGTPNYMAPEQAVPGMGEPGTATDVYGLGVVLYQMLTGRTPFIGDTVAEVLEKIVHREPAKPHLLCSGLDRDLETICLHCLEKRPEDRYFFAGALADDLERWLRGEPIQARPTGASERLWKWVARRRAVATLATVAACSVLALAVALPIAYLRIKQAGEDERLERARAEHELRVARQQRSLAEEERAAAADHWSAAEKSRTAAERQRSVAEQSRREAEAQRAAAELSLYVPDMKLAQLAWEQGYASRVRQLLTNHAASLPGRPDLRGFEWYHWQHELAADSEFTFRDHPDHAVQSVAWSPQGQWLLTACATDAQLVEARTGKVMRRWPLRPPFDPGRRRGLAFSRDGEWLAATGAEGFEYWHRNDERTVFVPSGPCSTVAFAPGETVLATGLAGRGDAAAGDRKVRIFDLAPSDVPSFRRIGQFTSEALALGWAANSRTLIAITPAGTIRMFGLASNAVVRTLRGSNTLTAAALSPNGRWAARALPSGQIHLTDLASGQTRFRWREPSPIDVHLDFSANSRLLAAAGGGQLIRLWETETGRELPSLRGHTGPVLDVAFGVNEQILASVGHDNQTHLWRRQEKTAITYTRGAEQDTEYPNPPLFSPDGSRLALGTRSDEFVVGGRSPSSMRSTNHGRALAFSPDGSRLLVWAPAAGQLELRQVESGLVLRVIPLWPTPARFPALTISPDGRWVAGWVDHRQMAVYDAVTGQARHRFDLQAAGWQFSPDGRKLALLAAADAIATNSYAVTNVLLIADLTTGGLSSSLARWSSPSLCFSPDGRKLAVAPEFGTLAILDPGTGRLLAQMPGPRSVILSMSFTPDGERLATGSLDDDVVLWHVKARREVASFAVPGPVNCVAFSPDGRLLVAGGAGAYQFLEAPGLEMPRAPVPRTRNGTASVWDLAPGR
ncbi:MAG TPA: serine/threonine-protein kinase [Verrucomicrobiae bacterium]|nr:serine/threonine-protein kinase [Verrucomicrobiae bacterium]